VPQSTEAEFNEAVAAASEAFKTWSQVDFQDILNSKLVS